MKFWLLLLFVMSAQAAEAIKIDVAGIESMEKRPYFKSHADRVGIPLPLAPVEALRKDLEKHLGKALLHPTEVQITVITPSEWRILGQVLKMDRIEKILVEHGTMKAKIKVLCLKKVTAMLAGKMEESWFIAVESDELHSYRQKVWRRFVANGGMPNDFQWKRWSPHLTVGYTQPSVNDEDLISKDKSECALSLASI